MQIGFGKARLIRNHLHGCAAKSVLRKDTLARFQNQPFIFRSNMRFCRFQNKHFLNLEPKSFAAKETILTRWSTVLRSSLTEQSQIKKSANYQPIGALAPSSLCLKHAKQHAFCASLIIDVRNGCDVRNAQHGKRRHRWPHPEKTLRSMATGFGTA